MSRVCFSAIAFLSFFLALSANLAANLTANLAHGQPDAGAPADKQPPVDLGKLLARQPSVQATAYVSADQVVLGRPFSVIIVVNAQGGDGRALDAAVPTSFAQQALEPYYDIGRRFTERVIRVGGIPATEIQIEMTAWQVGNLMVPRFPVDVPVAGEMKRVYTEPVPVTVVGLVGDNTATLRDIGAPVAIVYTEWMPVFVAAGVLLALIVARGLWRFRRQRPDREETDSPDVAEAIVVEEPAGEARRRLRELAEADGFAEQPAAPTVRELSAIVRRYLVREFDLAPAGEATSADIVAGLRRHEWISATGDLGQGIADWLNRCDLIKFADVHASADDVRALHEQAWTIVAETCDASADESAESAELPGHEPLVTDHG